MLFEARYTLSKCYRSCKISELPIVRILERSSGMDCRCGSRKRLVSIADEPRSGGRYIRPAGDVKGAFFRTALRLLYTYLGRKRIRTTALSTYETSPYLLVS